MPDVTPEAVVPDVIPEDVIRAARAVGVLNLVRRKDEPLRRAITCEGRVVGFCHPHETKRGFRLGPLFVLPDYRSRGLLREAYATHAAGKRCIAFIHTWNERSARAHAAAGFVLWKQQRAGSLWLRTP